jgi:hypothetical protein
MNAQNSVDNKLNSAPKHLVGGLILIVIGAIALVGQFVQTAWYPQLILGALAVVFLTAGLATRQNGFIIPGGILAGLSLGVLTQQLVLDHTLDYKGGLFLLSFASGWVLISLLSLVNGKWMAWPLIPGAILAAVGGAVMVGGSVLAALKLFGNYGWPLVLIAVGAWILLRRK